MPVATAKSAYWSGVRDGLPFLLVVTPFAILFGVVAMDAGLTLGQTMGFSITVFAGAAQFAALQLMVENAGIALVLLAALAVNLRMAMYSAALVPWLGAAPLWQRALVAYVNVDQTYAVSMVRFDERSDWGISQRVGFFLGVATPITPMWVAMTAVGALLGSRIPPEWALDFALPITFIGMVAPMLKTLAHLVAAAVSVTVALLLIGLPSGLGLLIAAGAAMVAGATVETLMQGRAA